MGNLARPSLASVHNLIHFDRLLPELPRADLLVDLVGVNDLQLALKSSYIEPTPERNLDWAFALRPPEGGVAGRLATVRAARFVWRTWQQARLGFVQTRDAAGYARLRECRQTAPPANLVDVLPDLTPALDEYRRNLRALAARARAYGAPMLFLTQPTLWAKEMGPAERARLLAGGLGPDQDVVHAPALLRAGSARRGDAGLQRRPAGRLPRAGHDVPGPGRHAPAAGGLLLRRHASLGGRGARAWPSWWWGGSWSSRRSPRP